MKFVRKLTLTTLALALATALPAFAQSADPFPPGLAKKLAARASKYSATTLDKNALNSAAQLMNKKKDQETLRLMHKVNAIDARAYKFDKPGLFTSADLARILANLKGPEWVPIAQARSHTKEGFKASYVYEKIVNGETEGLVALAAKPQKLAFVYISGHISPSNLGALGALGGKLGAAEAHSHTRAKPDHHGGSHPGSSPGSNQ